jgi:hypothetical protein
MSAVDSCKGSGTLREGREGAAVSFFSIFFYTAIKKPVIIDEKVFANIYRHRNL